MRIFLTGASGLLGINYALIASKIHDLLGIYHTKPLLPMFFKTAQFDLFDTKKLTESLTSWRPDWIVHCAALADINQCEADPELAVKLNVVMTKQLANFAEDYKIKFLYISTDCVFDGEKNNYSESDSTNPLNIYGKTKLLGEEAVLTHCSHALIARVNFYGWSLTGKRSLAEWIIQALKENKTITGFYDVFFSPLLVNHLTLTLLEMMSFNLMGIYHVGSNECISKYDFAILLAKQFNLDSNLIKPGSISTVSSLVKRPLNISLNNTKLQKALAHFTIPSLKEGINTFQHLHSKGYPQQLYSLQGKDYEN